MAIWKAAAAALAVALGIGLVLGRVLQAHWPAATVVAATAVLLALALVLANDWWRKIDDMARDAHTTAWWWGGCYGAGLGVVAAAGLGGGARSPLAQGAMLLFACQFVAYFLVWAAWWLAHGRRPAA